MSDANVTKAQKYLNAMFGANEYWEHLEENGKTGTAVMQGIIRAFQIQNGIIPATGTVGPLTVEKMKSLPNISKMDPNDEPQINVCLIQCALFCKGYSAGGITGIYYNSGVKAIKEMQSDAGLPETGVIDWKVWFGLLSLNWFKKVSGGDSKVVTIQRQLNKDWSDVIGVGPCDGIISRQTALSLIGALQAAEGVTKELIINLNSLNFGPATTAAFPKVLQENQNSSNLIPYNKLVQYGLYFNGYDPGRFDGTYDYLTAREVEAFQEFYCLTDIGLVSKGKVDVSTMKSLLTSKGDVNRKAKACDCATVLNKQQALAIKNAGYTHVGRYLTGYVGKEHVPKYMTHEEVANIENAGLSVFPIYQDGGYYLDYFKKPSQGSVDAKTAILAAERIGIPKGTTIYFAVDFDCYGYQIDTFIVPYFKKIKLCFNSSQNKKNYRVGIYAPRFVCTKVSALGLAYKSFVSDMSTGFSCNLGYRIPENWAFDQFHTIESFEAQPTFPIDKDAMSGRDKGFNKFDKVEEKNAEELKEENLQAKMEIARNQFVYDVMSPLGYLDNIMDAGIEYDKEIPLLHVVSPEGEVDVTTVISTSVNTDTDKVYSINVGIGNDGKLTQTCQNEIVAISADLINSNIDGVDKVEDMLKEVAFSVKSGNITFEVSNVMPLSVEFTLTVSSPDLLPEEDVECGISVALKFKISLNPNNKNRFNEELVYEAAKIVVATAVTVIVIYAILNSGLVLILEAFTIGVPSLIGMISAGA
ncbi:glycoside hydrolase domain-containing protein [Lachnospira multipara]|uniref:Peptidoglycan-binding (PGRP) domain of peptidoglycan hydrolases-containing protein n=1 Tax=Lachnospira multipara TaxID=28051 RepID=A0A1H5WSV6_9FIRM|nr:glycoside hydrolase domain-containing protein [Lachnospira multipara]SEG02514.1 Peptidoglycan-binding (PGRP) domain of peptidoglycan hydrolases-containing protein [Lachnospira multipara]